MVRTDSHLLWSGYYLCLGRRTFCVYQIFCSFWDQMQWARSYFHMHHYGWQDLTRRLYDCAAEVTKELKK